MYFHQENWAVGFDSFSFAKATLPTSTLDRAALPASALHRLHCLLQLWVSWLCHTAWIKRTIGHWIYTTSVLNDTRSKLIIFCGQV